LEGVLNKLGRVKSLGKPDGEQLTFVRLNWKANLMIKLLKYELNINASYRRRTYNVNVIHYGGE
jgi:hypothetical protein